jgi:hypothetical protein
MLCVRNHPPWSTASWWRTTAAPTARRRPLSCPSRRFVITSLVIISTTTARSTLFLGRRCSSSPRRFAFSWLGAIVYLFFIVFKLDFDVHLDFFVFFFVIRIVIEPEFILSFVTIIVSPLGYRWFPAVGRASSSRSSSARRGWS